MDPTQPPARLLVMGTDDYRDVGLVAAELDIAARWLNADAWTGRPGVRRDLVIVLAPAPAEGAAEDAAYRWSDRRRVRRELPPDGWEVIDDPDAEHARDLIIAADVDLVVAFERGTSTTMRAYGAAAVALGVPLWAFLDHRGRDVERVGGRTVDQPDEQAARDAVDDAAA